MKTSRKFFALGTVFLFYLGLLFNQPEKGLAATATPAPNGPYATDWILTFDDEFNGTAVDRNIWSSNYSNGGHGELQQYVADNSHNNYIEQNGLLSLVARQESYLGKSYTSGIIISRDTFFQKYGYYEIRANLPKGKGYWPAFWLMPNPSGNVPEIDILENIGSDVMANYMTLHYYNTSGVATESTSYYTGTDFSSGYHTFAVDWEPNAINWYVDGHVRKTITDTSIIPNVPMFIIANLAVGGSWPGSPDSTTVFPGYYNIDYIRVWQHNSLMTPAPPPTYNMVKNYSFEQAGANPFYYPWTFRNDLGAAISQDTTTAANSSKASLKIALASSNSSQPWVVSAMQSGLSLTAGQSYAFNIYAKASASRPFQFYVQEKGSPYTVYFSKSVTLGTAWTKYSYTFTASATTSTAMVNLNFASATGTLWVDEVSMCLAGQNCTATLAGWVPTPTITPWPTATAGPSVTPTRDTVPPTVSITSPANGAQIKQLTAITISALASDGSNVAKVEFRVNGVLTCIDSKATYDCPWTVPSGAGITYTLEARAYDIYSNYASASIKITSTQ